MNQTPLVLLCLPLLAIFCAVIRPFKPFQSRNQAIVIFIVAAFFTIPKVMAFNSTKNEQLLENTTKPVVSDLKKETEDPQPVKQVKEHESKWEYDLQEDQMTQKKAYFAALASENTVNFDFPYQGYQKATLMLRTHPQYGKAVILSIQKGQFLCNSYSGCKVSVRFDNEKPIVFSATEPSDNSTTTIFINNYPKFVKKLLRSKKIFIQSQFFHEGNRVFEFDVLGFDVKKYRPN